MTTWQFLALVVGEAWAEALWPVVRHRDDLLGEICKIAPRWDVRLRGDGTAEVWDVHAAARAAWVAARSREVGQ